MSRRQADPASDFLAQERTLRAAAEGASPPHDARDVALAQALAREALAPPPSDLVASIVRAAGQRRPRSRTLILPMSVATGGFVAVLAVGVEGWAGGLAGLWAGLQASGLGALHALVAAALLLLPLSALRSTRDPALRASEPTHR